MFPIPWNFPFRKKNGDMSTIGDVIGGAGSELPPHGVGDAGKVLGVDSAGDLEWSNEVPPHVDDDAGKLLSVDESGELEWSDKVPLAIQSLTDKLDDEVETRATLGAHNLCSFNESFTLVRGTDDTNRIKDISINSVPILNSYVVSFKVSNASNATKINLQIGKRNSSMSPASAVSDLSDGRKVITIAFSEEVNRLYFYLTSSDPSDATITISEVMITSLSDPSTEYTPYAMTNRELTPTLLWSNSAPTSDFAGQMVTLSQAFANFKFLEIFYAQPDGSYQGSVKVVSKSGGASVLKDYVLTDALAQLRTRFATPNDTNKITFGDGYVCNISSGATVGTLNNTVCIPLEVYGIK